MGKSIIIDSTSESNGVFFDSVVIEYILHYRRIATLTDSLNTIQALAIMHNYIARQGIQHTTAQCQLLIGFTNKLRLLLDATYIPGLGLYARLQNGVERVSRVM